MAKKVVPGSITKAYEKREGDFSPDLVGFQFTKSSSLFTLGNFSLTTNTDSLTGGVFNTGTFSEPYTLDTMDLTIDESSVINNKSVNLRVTLKNNKSNFLSYVYFGNATKFIETEITEIITNWKGSIYFNRSTINNTVTGYTYNPTKKISRFKLPTGIMKNVFNLDTSNDSLGSVDPTDINSIVNNFTKYEISNEFGEFGIIGYTGNTEIDSYITVEVNGLVWPTLTASTFGSFTYHLRPSDLTLDKIFFNRLSDFQNQLLNRLTIPKYTIKIDLPYKNSLGYTFSTTKEYTWPTTDGYNIDITGRNYLEYLQPLFDTIKSLDLEKTNIMTRRLVATSILEFDTAGDGTTTGGRKMDKMLKIWGREFDEVKKYIDGISFANVVSYDGNDNMPDELIKMMASNLGFDTIQSFSDNNLINYLATTTNTVFSGNSRSLSIEEMDKELWRRLVINAWWLFKSKGTRKVIEFFLNLFQIDECLVDLNECVYLVNEKLNPAESYLQVSNILGVLDLDTIPMDTQGYPKILPNTPEYYFQMDGFWYDGGVLPNSVPDTNGNNPHFGPYDFGKSYFDKFRCFVDDFNVTTNTVELNTLTFNYFTDYSYGTVEGTGGGLVNTNGTTSTNGGNILSPYNQFYGNLMNEFDRITDGSTVTTAGSTTEQSNSGSASFKVTIFTGDDDSCRVCPPKINLVPDGTVSYQDDVGKLTLTDEVCCNFYGYDTYLNIGNGIQECYWCAPTTNFVLQTVTVGTTVYTEVVIVTKGVIETPSKQCCILRGYKWDDLNGRCVDKPGPTLPLPPVPTSDS